MPTYPTRIICLTEESVESLYLLGAQERIAGISTFVQRPAQARKNHPIVSAFTHANIEKIVALAPDLVLGHSDIQKDIARDLIGRGLDVWIANHRSLESIVDYVWRLGALVGRQEQALVLCRELTEKMQVARRFAATMVRRPRVYIEEWDDPMITGIRWFSELVELCGGEVLFRQHSQAGILARERTVEWDEVRRLNPDIMLACWCGKPLARESVLARPGANEIKAIAGKWLLELDPAVFLQPGPAPILEGIDQLIAIYRRWQVGENPILPE